MSNKNIHITRTGNGQWQAKKEGSQRASSITGTQAKAVTDAIRIAKREGTEVFIHGRNGKIRERNTYGRAPGQTHLNARMVKLVIY
jgi:hypothetical protein